MDTIEAILYGILAVIFVTLVSQFFVVISPGQVGVQTTLGQISNIYQPGFYMQLPIISSTTLLSTKIEKHQIEAMAATSNLQDVGAIVAVNYRINNSYDNIHRLYTDFNTEYDTRILDPFTQEAIKSVTAKYEANDLITKRENVRNDIKQHLKDKIEQYGIDIIDLSIVNFSFSQQYSRAIEEKMVADQNRQKAQYELEMRQIEVQKQVVEANASATAKIIAAEADAKAIYIVTNNITDKYMRYYELQRWDGKLPLVVGNAIPMFDIASSIPGSYNETNYTGDMNGK